MNLSTIISAIMITVCISSCSSTQIISSWKAEDAKTKPYHNIMVWALLTEKDSSIRRQMETHLVNDLVSHGYHAVSSTDVYREKAYKKLTSTEILNEFKNTGIDAVITLALLDKEKEEKYYPPALLNDPSYNYGNLDKYYQSIYEKVFSPGYYISTTTYFWESSLFELPASKITYSVRTKSLDPFTTEKLAHENGLRIITDMIRKKVILDIAPKEDQ